MRAQRCEVVSRDEADGHLPAGRIDGARGLGDDVVEEIPPFADGLVVAPAKGGATSLLRTPPNRVQAVRIVHGERPQHVGVEDGEDDRHQAQANRERQDRGGDKGAALTQPAPCVAQIVGELFDPDESVRVVKAFTHARRIAERAVRRGARLVGRHPLAHQPIRFVLEMRADLGREVLVAAWSPPPHRLSLLGPDDSGGSVSLRPFSGRHTT